MFKGVNAVSVGIAEQGRQTETPAVVVEKVQKHYASGTVAIRNVSFSIKSGEFVSLVGPSGCGKSTLLRMIAGLGETSSGNIRVYGESPTISHVDNRLSFVFQDATLMPWRTVLPNVALPLELAGVSKREREQRALSALRLVGLEHTAKSYPRELSGGMRMRVSLARALVSQPKLLLLDEPFGALDELTRQHLNGELLRLWQENALTALFVTHNVFEAVFLSQRIVVMTAQPSRIASFVEIDAPYPRDDAFRSTPTFGDAVGRVLECLRGERGMEE